MTAKMKVNLDWLFTPKQLSVKHNVYLSGGISKAIANNVLNELRNVFGLDFQFDKHNSFQFTFRDYRWLKSCRLLGISILKDGSSQF